MDIKRIRKTISLILVLLVTAALAAGCTGGGSSAEKDASEEAVSYEEFVFDTTRVHTIDVSMSKEDREDQLKNPTEKTKYDADVVIDGEKFENIVFNTKGNSSLFFTADAGKEKFSYGINFVKNTEGKTFHGLDKLNLQNNFIDASAMKEYMAYWLFRQTGINAPLASYAQLTVNGEDQGLYTIIEGVEDSFLERTSGGAGTIYKPEDTAMDLTEEELERLGSGESAAHDNGGGADLVYRGDDEKSYPDIFENAETDDDEETRARVIRSLKALSERKELEKYLDTEEIIKYFAVHDFLVAYDSYTGLMLHNYCLYENDGRLAMLPWDYDLAFGKFNADARVNNVVDSNEAVNAGIDSPLGVVPDEARPMWNWILSDENYLSEYHDRMAELVGVIGAGSFEKEAARVYELIAPYREKDPKAFFTKEQFQKAYDTLLRFTELRAESVRRQVNGQLSTRSESQSGEDKVDASAISIRDMGNTDDLYN